MSTLWSWGANSCGQLGLGVKSEQFETPQRVRLPMLAKDEEVVEVAGGGSHTLLLSRRKDGRGGSCVYATGSNAKGQLGLEDGGVVKELQTFRRLDFPSESDAVQVACGWDFSFVLRRDGSAYGFGSNAFGQLGVGKDAENFAKVDLPSERVTSIRCGMRHSLFLTESGNVYGCGCGKKGQLGLASSTGRRIASPTRIGLSGFASAVGCGQSFSLVLLEDGGKRVLAGFGDNKHGQLRPDDAACRFEEPVALREFPPSGGSVSIFCGWTHVLMLEGDALSSWGRNSYGQLGRRNGEGGGVTALREKVVRQASCGYEHAMAVTRDGKLFVWGWNEHGNCGLNGVENVTSPTVLEMPSGGRVAKCFAGSGHSFCVEVG